MAREATRYMHMLLNPAENYQCINENSCLLKLIVTKDTGGTSLYQCTQANERMYRNKLYL